MDNKFFSKEKRSAIEVIVVLIIVSLLVASGFLIAFLWAVKSGQYKDTYTPSIRILFDDADKEVEKNTNAKK
ncbi:MAG: cbb3-type cytochrome oxidase assembly protein CcoS [Ignavibacteriaceae bacterium]